MTGLQTKELIACLQMFSKKESFALCSYASKNNITPDSVSGMLDCIRLCQETGVLSSAERHDRASVARNFETALYIMENSAKKGIKAVSYFEELFPVSLREIRQGGMNTAPLVLYYKGNIKKAAELCGVALIGTRQPSEDGIRMGEYFGNFFAGEGFNIISGLAAGCDAAAHRGALKAKGMTTAFVANGLDYVHPRENVELAAKILLNGGVIISEYPVGTKHNFETLIERNRLQAGLADAVVLIQTNIKKGGSMHAVNTALQNKKPVFAVQYANSAHQMVLGNIKLLNENKAKPLTPNNKEEISEMLKSAFNC
jgi:DNA processing protein